jgi:hypothetical protein
MPKESVLQSLVIIVPSPSLFSALPPPFVVDSLDLCIFFKSKGIKFWLCVP